MGDLVDTEIEAGPNVDASSEPTDEPTGDVWSVLDEWVPTALRILSVLAVTLPILASAFVALQGGWIPTADVAVMSLRAGDVLGGEVPLVGMHTTAAEFGGEGTVYHPGPLTLWLLAPFVLVAGEVVGLVLGAVALNLTACCGILWVARRRGGDVLMATAALFLAVLLWSLRGEILRDPWNPHVAVLAFLLFLFLAWAVADGDHRLAPVFVVVGSFVGQNHVTYLPLLVVVGLVSLGLWLVPLVRGATASRSGAQRALRWVGYAIVAGVAAWIGPLVDQFTGDANLGKLLAVAGSTELERLGLWSGLQRTAGSLGAVPLWLSHTDDIFRVARQPSIVDLLVAFATVVGALWAAFEAHRRHHRDLVHGIVLAVTALVGAAFVTARAPADTLAIELYWYRWLWPIGMFLWFTALVAAARLVTSLPRRSEVAQRAPVALSGALVVLVVAALLQPGVRDDRDGPRYQHLSRLAASSAEVLEGTGPYHVTTDGTLFWHKSTIVAALERAGIRTYVDRDDLPWGERRIMDPDRDVAGRLLLTGGPNALEGPEGSRLIAFVPITAEAQDVVAQHIRAQVSQQPVTLVPGPRDLLAELIEGTTPDELRRQREVDRWPADLQGFFEVLVRGFEQQRPTDAAAPIALDLASLDDQALLFVFRFGVIEEGVLTDDVLRVLNDPLFRDGYAQSEGSGMAVHLLPPE